ncbi:hypothetical protein GCM10010430_60160 [Kitasatospora cystarginea]|uniref:Uncharacterized protein n=1 Tax=Kitasatospora cystarginea TaxID=58350 RepID=A0ABN3EQG3_9ACTN
MECHPRQFREQARGPRLQRLVTESGDLLPRHTRQVIQRQAQHGTGPRRQLPALLIVFFLPLLRVAATVARAGLQQTPDSAGGLLGGRQGGVDDPQLAAEHLAGQQRPGLLQQRGPFDPDSAAAGQHDGEAVTGQAVDRTGHQRGGDHRIGPGCGKLELFDDQDVPGDVDGLLELGAERPVQHEQGSGDRSEQRTLVGHPSAQVPAQPVHRPGHPQDPHPLGAGADHDLPPLQSGSRRIQQPMNVAELQLQHRRICRPTDTQLLRHERPPFQLRPARRGGSGSSLGLRAAAPGPPPAGDTTAQCCFQHFVARRRDIAVN